jgi:hypothetical protein
LQCCSALNDDLIHTYQRHLINACTDAIINEKLQNKLDSLYDKEYEVRLIQQPRPGYKAPSPTSHTQAPQTKENPIHTTITEEK